MLNLNFQKLFKFAELLFLPLMRVQNSKPFSTAFTTKLNLNNDFFIKKNEKKRRHLLLHGFLITIE